LSHYQQNFYKIRESIDANYKRKAHKEKVIYTNEFRTYDSLAYFGYR